MPHEFSITRRVQFAETDMAGVMHFSNYFRLMEEVEHAWWRSMGLSVYMGDGPHQVSWPRVAVRCEYSAAARFEDELELLLRLGEIGDRSLTLQVEFRRDGKRIAHGEMKTVCCAMENGRFRSVTIPAEIRSKITA